MKKMLYAMGAMAMIAAMVGCGEKEKENEKPNRTEPEEVTVTEGVYSPEIKIKSIEYDGYAETWQWNGEQLESITTSGEPSDGMRDYTFGYDNKGRLTQMNLVVGQLPVAVGYAYGAGGYLTDMTATSVNAKLLDGEIEREGTQKIIRVWMEVDTALAGLMNNLLGGFMGNGGLFGTTKGKNGSKMSVDKSSIVCDLTWQGENVERYVQTTTLSVNLTLDEIRQMPMFDSLLGVYGAFLDFIPGTTPVPVTFGMSEEKEYTYDTKKNPLQGLMRKIEVEVVSANNVLTEDTKTTMSVAISFSGMEIPPYSVEMGEEHSSYSYEYNESGYPTVAKEGGEIVRKYNYSE